MAEWLKRLLKRNREQQAFCTAVVPAAGSSTRMGGQDKILLTLGDVPVLMHTLRALDSCPRIQEIVVVTREDLIVPISQLCREGGFTKIKSVVVGGASRAESVLRGIREASEEAELIAIHDGARPLVSQAVLDEVIRKAEECGAAAPQCRSRTPSSRQSEGSWNGRPTAQSSLQYRRPRSLMPR